MSDLSDFDYDLPPAQIAQQPTAKRTQARLLDVRNHQYHPTHILSLPTLLQKGDLIVANDSRVLPARLLGNKESGGSIEIFAERFLDDGSVLAQVRASRAPQVGSKLIAGGGVFVVLDKKKDFYHLQARNKQNKIIASRPRFLRHGLVPLPPYIRRAPKHSDRHRYQTMFARQLGSAAAPTAGLHFTPSLIRTLSSHGIEVARLTLHVGAGTFMPLRAGLATQKLHAESYCISSSVAARINATKKNGGRIIALGTTTLRALESSADAQGVHAANTETTLFIKSGYHFRVADMLITNFHLPRSSLLVLVCAFGGHRRVLDAYRFAVENNFRFYSYGDAMLLSRGMN